MMPLNTSPANTFQIDNAENATANTVQSSRYLCQPVTTAPSTDAERRSAGTSAGAGGAICPSTCGESQGTRNGATRVSIFASAYPLYSEPVSDGRLRSGDARVDADQKAVGYQIERVGRADLRHVGGPRRA